MGLLILMLVLLLLLRRVREILGILVLVIIEGEVEDKVVMRQRERLRCLYGRLGCFEALVGHLDWLALVRIRNRVPYTIWEGGVNLSSRRDVLYDRTRGNNWCRQIMH